VHNLVVRPRDWSTYGERVKTDSRDAAAQFVVREIRTSQRFCAARQLGFKL